MPLFRTLFDWNGRIDRATYLRLCGLFVVLAIAGYLIDLTVAFNSPDLERSLSTLAAAASGWSGLAINAKRLRDMGKPPLLAVPPAALIALSMIFGGSDLVAPLLSGDRAAFAFAAGGGLLQIAAALLSLLMTGWLGLSASAPLGPEDAPAFRPSQGRAVADATPSLGLEKALEAALAHRDAPGGSPTAPPLARPPVCAASPRPIRAAGGSFGRRR